MHKIGRYKTYKNFLKNELTAFELKVKQDRMIFKKNNGTLSTLNCTSDYIRAKCKIFVKESIREH